MTRSDRPTRENRREILAQVQQILDNVARRAPRRSAPLIAGRLRTAISATEHGPIRDSDLREWADCLAQGERVVLQLAE